MIIPAPHRGARLDHAVSELLRASGHEVSIREVRRALKSGAITVDGAVRGPGERAQGGEAIDLGDFVPRREARVPADPVAASRAPVLLEDEHLLVLAKPSGMSSAPLAPGETGTLLSAAIAHAPGVGTFGPPLEGGLLHRLDLETSGVVLFAKDEPTRRALREDFATGRVVKRYLALTVDPAGALPDRAVVEGFIVQSGARVRLVEAPISGGLPSRTEVSVRERFRGFALVEAIARTGRRHQIRVHLASLGAPLAGDPLYGDPTGGPTMLDRLALHAASVGLRDGRVFEAPLPADLVGVLAALRAQ